MVRAIDANNIDSFKSKIAYIYGLKSSFLSGDMRQKNEGGGGDWIFYLSVF
jgi:hypothetical protein